MALSSFRTKPFEMMIGELLVELDAMPLSRSEILSLESLDAGTIDKVTVFDHKPKALRSAESGQ